MCVYYRDDRSKILRKDCTLLMESAQRWKGFLLFLWWITWKHVLHVIMSALCSYLWLKQLPTVQPHGPGKGKLSYQGISVSALGPLPPTCLLPPPHPPPRPQRSGCRLRFPASSHTIDRNLQRCVGLPRPPRKEYWLHSGIRGLENIGLLPFCCVFLQLFHLRETL